MAIAALVVRLKLPSVVKVARSMAVEPLFKVMWAVLPPAVWVVKVTAPVKALELSSVMALSLTSVINALVPPTVMTPESVIVLPAVTERFWPQLIVPRFMAVVPLSIVMSPVPVVVADIAPVMALVAVFIVIDLSAAVVVKLEVPVTVRAPVWVMSSPAVTERLPFTV